MNDEDKAFDLLVCDILDEEYSYTDDYILYMMRKVWDTKEEEIKQLRIKQQKLYKNWLEKSNKLMDMEFKYE